MTERHSAASDRAPRHGAGYLRRIGLVAGPALVGPVMLFLIGPHTIYNSNRSEFSTSFIELAQPRLLMAVVINWLLLAGAGSIMALFSERLVRMYAALLLAFGLLLWGQGHLWNPDYGVLAGREIDFNEHAWRGPYELAAWAAALLLALVFFRPLSRIASFAALVFIAVQISAAAVTTMGPDQTPRARWAEPPPAIYQFSSKQNIVHIVLDEFQSDLFTEMLEQDHAALERDFGGFQYFMDHAGSFPTTSFSMPAMLAAQEYRNHKPAPEFMREAFKQASILERASQAGYEIDAASIMPFVWLNDWLGPEEMPNWRGARFHIRKPFVSRTDYREMSARQLLELSFFRHVPHSMKVAVTTHPQRFYRLFWSDRGESPVEMRRHDAGNSVAFFRQFISVMSVGRERPVYKLIHLGLPHRPVVVDRECRFVGEIEFSRQAYLDQSRCAIMLVRAFLDRVRALNIYDSSLIIVSSDHGTDLTPLGFNGESDSLPLAYGPSTMALPAIAGMAKALMLIKLPHRTGPMRISGAPTSHIDLPPTILEVLGLQGAPSDISMFRIDPRQARTRVFGMYDPRHRFPKGYLERMDVLSIDGRVIDADAWNVQHSIWRFDLRRDVGDVDIGPRASYDYLGAGWSLSHSERSGQSGAVTFVRPVTKKAVLFASLPTGITSLTLRASSAPTESIRVEVDGRDLGALRKSNASGYTDHTISIP